MTIRPRDGWRRWWVAAVEAGAAVGLVDAAVAMGRFGERLPSRRDRLAFALSLAGVSALSFALVALAGCALWAAALRVPARARPALSQMAVIAGGIALGFALFSGTAMRHSPGRPWAILATAALGALISQVLGPAVARARLAPAGRVALLFASAGLYLLHAFAYVRLYPGLHAFCAAGAVFVLIAALAAGVREPVSAPVALVTLAVAAGGAAGAANLRHAEAQRALAAHRAPVSGYAVRALEAAWPRERVAGVVRDERFGAGPSLDFRGRDVVIVTVDALRADRLAPYGGRAELAPALAGLAAQGLVFERVYCTTPHTSYSITSLMTGKYMRELSALGAPAQAHETLARWLGAAGYATAGFFPPAVFTVDGDRLGDLPARRLDFATTDVAYVDAGARVVQVARWLDSVPAGNRVFVWVHFFEPHEPYESHPGGRAGAGDGPVARYDGEVAAVDDAFARLRAEFTARGREPAWIVTADHGEEFGEHGGRFHGTTLYDEQIRVPLIVAAPGLAPAHVAGPVSLIDVAPTILAALGLPRPPRLRGRDLGPAVLRRAPPVPVYASVEHERAVIDGSDKLVCDRSGGACELYDLATDPGEVANLIDGRPERARALAALLEGWTGSHGRFDREAGGATPGDHEAEIERLLQGDAAAANAVARALAAGLDAPNARRAVEALLALAQTGDPGPRVDRVAVSDAVASQLGHADAAVRTAAAVALTLFGDERGLPGALDALRGSDPAMQRAAALGLAGLGRSDGASVLAAWALDTTAAGRERAAGALAAIRWPDSRATWEALLDDPALSPTAADALGQAGERASVPALERVAASTRYALTLDAAVRALASLHSGSATSFLERELTLADLAPGAMQTARTLGEPGRSLAGNRPTGGTELAPGRSVLVPLHGPRPPGAALAVLEVEATVAGRVRIEGVDVALAAGVHALRVPLRAAPGRLRLEANVPARVRAVILAPVRGGRAAAS